MTNKARCMDAPWSAQPGWKALTGGKRLEAESALPYILVFLRNKDKAFVLFDNCLLMMYNH
ncbi:hypothetical protein AGMMS49587_01660 [Spirochaetia bacterium]|nr:hypothetical protein AGMMS49587_01660 [Spirochaetia bacterium]